MALTVRNISDDDIQLAKELTGKGTASAALVEAVFMLESRTNALVRAEQRIQELQEQVSRSDRVVHRLASAADECLAVARQKELL